MAEPQTLLWWWGWVEGRLLSQAPSYSPVEKPFCSQQHISSSLMSQMWMSVLSHWRETRWVSHPNTKYLLSGAARKLGQPPPASPPLPPQQLFLVAMNSWCTVCSGKVRRQQVQGGILTLRAAVNMRLDLRSGPPPHHADFCVGPKSPVGVFPTASAVIPMINDHCEILTCMCLFHHFP